MVDTTALPTVRKGQGPERLDRAEFERRMRLRFVDPAFDAAQTEIARIIAIAWEAYREGRKAPRRRKAGPEFFDPDYELSLDWLAARDAIASAQREFERPDAKRLVLLVIGSPRNDKTCPGEISKTFRLVEHARVALAAEGCECDVLDLSVLTSEFGRTIYPCKGCVSTAMPLCHWPCSCYPNHSLGQTGDWMNEIYPRWVAAHGVMIVTAVHWLQAPTVLKSMIDRLVCADGGNPDPTSTHGKDPEKAKRLELDGWHYPRHLAGRAFAVVVHGDTEGAAEVRHTLTDWLRAMELVPSGDKAEVDRYIGYYEPYATSHDALDRDEALFQEVHNAAVCLARKVELQRKGIADPDSDLVDPRPK
jgi:multimeric flavodoxin WrbA